MISIIRGDVTTLAVDAIVNAANETLLVGGGVDGAIHRAAGPKLLAACRAPQGCPTGEARITPGFALPAKWVIHPVGPVWRGGQDGEPERLRSCYRASLELARGHGVRRIALSVFSHRFVGWALPANPGRPEPRVVGDAHPTTAKNTLLNRQGRQGSLNHSL